MTFDRSASRPLLEMKSISKRFAGIAALSEASLEVAAGEVHAVIGQNGAGKSTLIKVLTGYHRRDAGEVLFEGVPFEASSPHEAQRQGVSTIYQEINLVPLRSVTENICLGRKFQRYGLLDWRAMHAEAALLLRRFNVNIDVRRPLGSFSTATQQMVAIARAIGFSARLVIMDEPTSSLDEREVEILFGVIRQLKGEGVSVLYVSHKLDELYAVCDRVTIMRDGQTVRVASMKDIGKVELISAMLGRDVGKAEGHSTAFTRKTAKVGGVVFTAQHLAAGQSVHNVSFSVRRGEIAGFAGLLGAGRTETARLVFGADRVKAGAMTMDGLPYHPARAADGVAAGMGFCTEDRKIEGIIPEMSVAENMTLALLPRISRNGVVDENKQRQLVEGFIARLDIKCSGPDQRVRDLSGGNQQKVLLARWLAMSPKLLILDEPTRGIDVGAKAEIQRLIRALADQDGLAVVMISSELEEVAEGADRIFVLRDGITVAELEGDLVTEDQIVAAMALGHNEIGGTAS